MSITATSFETLTSTGGVSSSNDAAANALNALFNGAGISNVVFAGNAEAAFVVDTFSVAGVFSRTGGILLSSGGLPANSNTSGSYTVANDAAGDADLTKVAQTAFSGAGSTNDAVTISFDYTNTNPKINTLQFSFVFGSDEFPEWSDSAFVDVAAVFVNGVNQALFNNAADQPLSVIDKNVALGNFVDNTNGSYDIEWDGFSTILTIRAPLTLGVNSIKVGIADTGDYAYDSGLYITGVKVSSDGGTGGGTLVVVDTPQGGGVVNGTIAPEEVNLGVGNYTVAGLIAELNGDVITGFDDKDNLLVKDATFTQKDVKITYGSLILDIDSDGNGTYDTKVTLAGDFEGKSVAVKNTADGTELTVVGAGVVVPTQGNDKLNGTSGNDMIKGLGGNDTIKGLAGNDKLYGGNGNDKIYGGAGNDTLYGDTGDDKVYGDAGNDALYGGAGKDTLSGGAGDDKLFGNAGNDTLLGELGNDKLYGGAGNDRLTGGAGKDTFYFLDDFKGNDVITDFEAGKSKTDVIVFEKDILGSFADVKTHAADTKFGVVISYDDAKITLLGVKVADLHVNDFFFT